jgi:hypothetical protein
MGVPFVAKLASINYRNKAAERLFEPANQAGGEQDRIRAHSEMHENMRSEYKEERKTAHPKAGRSSY